MTQTHFPCPFCGRKMGVGPELLGRKVRCPHCKQVILAPAATPAAEAPTEVLPTPPLPPPPPPPVAVVPPPPNPVPDLPAFNLPSPEARDSIFGEAVEDSDEVFGGEPAPQPVPVLPPPVAPAPPVAAYAPQPAPPSPPPAVFAVPAAVPTADPEPTGNPFAGFGAAPAYTPPAAMPATPPLVPAVAYAPPPVATTDPWGGFDQSPPAAAVPQAAFAAPAPVPVQDIPPEPARRRRPADADRDERDRPRPDRRRAGEGGGAGAIFKIACFVLIPYALLMTVLAIYGLFIREGGKVPEGHPLSLIPDTRGEFPPAERKKTGRLGVPLDGPLPPELRAGLGKSVTIGAVEVEPVSVAVRKLTVVTEPERGKAPAPLQSGKSVVLTLKVKNTSSDLTFHPLDPAFNRKEGATDSPPTALVIGKSTYPGGPIAWPFKSGVKRVYEAAQAEDDRPLGPGESRTYVVPSAAGSSVVRAVENAKDSILWRVQVRRGLVEFRGREVPVTTLIGVEFAASDVTTEE